MKEATGETSLTVITLIGVALIAGIVAIIWPNVANRINDLWGKANGEDIEASDYVS